MMPTEPIATEGSSLLDSGLAGEVLPLTFGFEHLKYSIKAKAGPKVLLNDVCGVVKPGTVLAIMGPSGAGKTTLLDVLAGRATRGNLGGRITLNGSTFDTRQGRKSFRRITGYVMQDDSLIGALTVFECLDYVAQLKLPGLTKEQRRHKVDTVIQQLDIWKIRESIIGTQFRRGISGGERRRVAIGVELITSPSVLFLDEPTSGLDGASAYTVMKTIIDLGKTGCTVLCTIHQPRSNIFSLFDQLLLLTSGRVAYMGPAQFAMGYFENLGCQMNFASNPADWMLDLITSTTIEEDEGGTQPQAVQSDIDFPAAYESSATFAQVKEELATYQPSEEEKRTMERLAELDKYATGYVRQAVILFFRNSLSNIRNPSIIWVRLFQSILMACLVGSIFWQVPDTTDGIQGRMSALFFTTSFLVMSSFASLPILIEERGRFNREIQSNTYSTWAYFSAVFSSMLPFLILFAVAYGSVVYWLVGLQAQLDKFCFFLIAATVLALVGDAMVKAIGALVPTFSIAAALTSICLTFFMFFSGFFIKPSSLPWIWRWAPYISLFKYGFQAIMLNEFDDLSLSCVTSSGDAVPNCTVEGETVLEYMGINTEYSPWLDVLLLAVIWLAFRVLQFVFLKFLNKEKR